MKLNVPITGFLIGLFLPFIGMFIVYLVWRGNMGIGEFTSYLMHQKGMAAKVLLLGVLINLIPFVYFNLKKLDYAMRGIFIITMIYAMFIILLRFVW